MYLATSSAGQGATIGEQDRSEAISLATWVVLGVTVSVFIARQVMKALVFRKVALDDFFIFAATVFAIALSITTSLSASRGLGLLGPLTIEQANLLMKGFYASELLYVASLCFSKLSLLGVFYTIVAVRRTHQRVIVGLTAFIVLWSIISAISLAFQCRLPKPWEMMALRCFNTRVFWISYCVVDMCTEVAITTLSFNLIVCLRLRSLDRFTTVACFAPRALVVAASLIHLIWLYPVTPQNIPEYRLWLPAILSQVHVCLSICTACIPFMIPIFKSLEGNRRIELQIDESHTRTQPSLWFRRQRKSRAIKSWDCNAVASLQYQRVPQASPQISPPQPLSPFTPLRFNSRPGTAKSGSLLQFGGYMEGGTGRELGVAALDSRQGLSISIPGRNNALPRTRNVTSPQTASSFALSPSCTPLLSMHSLVSSRSHPTPPPKTHSPKPATASSCYSSHSPSPTSPAPRPARFSLFPQPITPEFRPSPDLRQSGFMPAHIPPIRILRPLGPSDASRQPVTQKSYASIDQSRTYKPQFVTRAPKFNTAPQPASPSSTIRSPTSRRRHFSVQELNSPMGAAINQYFRSAAPKVEPPLPPPVPMSTPTPITTPRSANRQRNHSILSPTNTLRTQKPLPRSPLPGTSPDLVRTELALPRDPVVMSKDAPSLSMPLVRDVPSSPRNAVRHV